VKKINTQLTVSDTGFVVVPLIGSSSTPVNQS
jgi:hypothetical protein